MHFNYKEINPNLVRSFNNFLEGYLAYKIFKSLNIPYVISSWSR